MKPIMAYRAHNPQAVKRWERRAARVQRDDVMHFAGVPAAPLAPPVLRAQLREPQVRPLAGRVDFTPSSAGHQELRM